MIWVIAVVIWGIILLLPKVYNGLKFILSLAVLYGIREAFYSWADHYVVITTTTAVLFFGSIIGVWVANQIQITRHNKRIDTQNLAKRAEQDREKRRAELEKIDSDM
ncbi:hypothetical protein [Weissella cibaria]|uniref:hypothetical protein n=1 Tax=Weissella cibaria TaxID=137591 RepID=UPI000705DD2C|nr:hypothetical protein [Weissella cibaria]ALI33931.1 hypothetical protein AO080_10975 [Weissella cibaria]